MAQKSRPDPAGGNVVTADEYEGIMTAAAVDGIIGTTADTPVVYADATGRQVKVRAGKRAMLRGYTWFSDSATDEIINNAGAGLPANTSSSPRIDRLVLRLDRAARTVRTVYLQGVAQPFPVAPALTQNPGITNGLWDFPLARWNVAAGYTTVAAADLTIEGWYRAPNGTVLCTSTSRPFGAYAYPGSEIYEADTNLWRYWNSGLTLWQMKTPYRQRVAVSGVSAPTLEINNIPSTLRKLTVSYVIKSDANLPNSNLYMKVNNVGTGQYYYINSQINNASSAISNVPTDTKGVFVGVVAGMPGGVGTQFGTGTINLVGWDLAAGKTDRLNFTSLAGTYPSQANSVSNFLSGMALVPPPYTSLQFSLLNGSLAVDSYVMVEGWE